MSEQRPAVGHTVHFVTQVLDEQKKAHTVCRAAIIVDIASSGCTLHVLGVNSLAWVYGRNHNPAGKVGTWHWINACPRALFPDRPDLAGVKDRPEDDEAARLV